MAASQEVQLQVTYPKAAPAAAPKEQCRGGIEKVKKATSKEIIMTLWRGTLSKLVGVTS